MSQAESHVQQYLVPRKVTARFELLPGIGWAEAIVLFLAGGVGYLVFLAFSAWGAPVPVRVGAVFPILGGAWILIQDRGSGSVAHILRRQFVFHRRQKRFIFRVGSGRGVSAKQSTTSRKGSKAAPAQQTVQQWFPVADIVGGFLHRQDGSLVGGLRVEPVNLGLKSVAEQRRLVAGLFEALNGLQARVQILSLPRPVDLDRYLRSLEERLVELDPGRQRLLRQYLKHVAGLVASGGAQERRFYILVERRNEKGAADMLAGALRDLEAGLARAGMTAARLGDLDWHDLLHSWSHPAQAATERAPDGPPSVTVLLEGGLEGEE